MDPVTLRAAKKYADKLLGKHVVDTIGTPGPRILKAGNLAAGFFGIVPASEFITGTDLAMQLGITQGTAINSDTPWIKYIWQNKICFTPLKPIRHSITWDAIYAAGAIYGRDDEGTLPPCGRLGTDLVIDGSDNSINTVNNNFLGNKSAAMDYADTVAGVGDIIVLKNWANPENNGEFTVDSITNEKIVLSGGTLVSESGGKTSTIYPKSKAVVQNATATIGGLEYSVRAFRSAANDPLDSYSHSDRDSIGPDNEWNGIILPLHEHAKLQNWTYSAYAGTTEDWGLGLTDSDLVTHYNHGSGSRTWGQEVPDATPWRRVCRGVGGASLLYAVYSWHVYSDNGLRPVLEISLPATL
jgi:hypothetical protein